VSRVVDICRLTPIQEAMLFRAVAEPESRSYVEQLHIWLKEAPDEAALRVAWDSLLERHDVLRTSFHHSRLARPQQVVHSAVDLPWRVVQLAEASSEAVEALGRSEWERGFQLQEPPLFRLLLVRIGDRGACLIWTFHHLLLDGWSLGRVLLEVDAAYRAAIEGRSDPRPPSRPFRDYIRWLGRQDSAAAVSWWASRLEGSPPQTSLPGGRGGPGEEHRRSATGEESRRIAEACRAMAVTLGAMARLAWAACLAETDGLREVCFATMVSGRTPELPGVDEIVGLFVNTTATRVRFEPGESARDTIARLQRESFEERPYDWAPLGDVLRAGGLAPLQSVLVVENYPLDRAILRDSPLQVDRMEVRERADVPLVVALVPGEELELRLASPPGGLTRASLESLADRLLTWMSDLAANPDTAFADLLGARERSKQAALRSGLNRPVRPARTLAEAIFTRGLRVEDERTSWSASELLERALWAARRAHAAPPGPIGLIGETSPETVARMLGCIRAGRTYAPLDASDPRSRERLAHAGAHPFEACAAEGLTGEADPPWPIPGAEAYLLYTSGSSGRPKAVRQSQAGVLAHASRFASSIGLGPEDRLCSTASFAFDAAVMDIFGCAITGATLRLASPTRLGLDQIRSRMIADATILHTTPSLFRLLATEPLGSAMRAVVLGGELVQAGDLELFASAAPEGCIFVNGFGPSESTTATQWFADREAQCAAVPIGAQVDGTTVRLVGPDRTPCPGPWAEGEIVIESDAVALGYLGTCDENERFSSIGDARSYRTGDLGRRRPSGGIDYLGRLDDQVQIGGVRVEPAEVARVLASLPGVSAAEVFAVGEVDDTRLEGWVTPAGVDTQALLSELRRRLPPSFVPSRLHGVRAFELLANGKVDRDKLRPAGPERAPDPGRPGGAAVETIARCFERVLGRPVGPDDGFFDLGGHSLDALRACGRLERELGRPVPLQTLFEHASPASLALALSGAPAEAPAPPPIPRAPRSWMRAGGAIRPSGQALSLFFFAAAADEADKGYELLIEATKRADELGLHAVWIPERHFAPFGGLYPNPSVLAAHLAAVTSRLRIRAGSVVLPLHDPLRVAEEWAVVDRLSGGRVDIAVASGWHRSDFSALAPGAYEDRKQSLLDKLAVLRRLWAGEAIDLPDEELGSISVRTWPRPVQRDLGVWLTSQAPESFLLAAQQNLNVLTNLNYKSLDDLRNRIALYREAEAGRNAGCVTVMTHALVGDDDAAIRDAAMTAYQDYTRANLDLQQSHARGADRALSPGEADVRALAARAARQKLDEGALIGDMDRCRQRLADLRSAGADEVACLIDFGVPPELALRGVERLAELASAPSVSAPSEPASMRFPAAPLQAQLWLLESLSEVRERWMIPTLVRLDGPLDLSVLQDRLLSLGRRHEAFRTRLIELDGVVQQEVFERLDLRLECEEADSEQSAINAARAILEAGMDVGHAPMARVVLYRIAPDHHVLLIACHHAISDGSSTAVIAQELLAGAPDDLPHQPGDWAAWMSARLESGDLDAQEAFWNKLLAEPPPPLTLAEGPATGRRRVYDIPLGSDLVSDCRDRCDSSKCTLFELMLGAFAVALGELAGRDDFIIGIHHANRSRPELEGLVGPLVNLLPLRLRIPRAQVLDGLRDQAREALRNHEVPYARLAARHGRRGAPRADPLVDVVMVHQNIAAPPQTGSVKWSRIELDGGSTRFPLTLVVRETHQTLDVRLEVDDGAFPPQAAERIAEALRASLVDLVEASPVARVEPSPAIWSAGPHLLSAFLEDAERHPDRTAVKGPDGEMSRGELLDGARRLAGELRRRLPAGTRVAVLTPPGCRMIVAVYGVLLADCTLVPLDARDPPARRRQELDLAEVALVVTDEAIQFDTLSPIQTGEPLVQRPTGEHPAYIIFTSGSTGAPKGVCVGHDSVRALIGWARGAFSDEELSGVLLTAPIRFDMSVFGLYAPLAGPGCIVVISSLAALVDAPPPEAVSLVYTAPSAMRALLAAGGELPATTRTVNLGGEAHDADLLAQLLQRVDRVCDMYGPTESTSNAFFEAFDRVGALSIGRPIAGTGAWIRRFDGRPARVGEMGELVLTGAGLALGYLNAPDDPAFTPAGYRTGDQACMLPDGRFTYHGRRDSQVKVRGFRLELGEVEHHLRQLPGVELAAARVRDDGLEALVVYAGAPAAPIQAPPDRVRTWTAALVEKLPSYATPTRWIALSALPLTVNGKLDRAAIAALDWTAPVAAGSAGAREAVIARTWEEILGVAAPDNQTSFFELGGHSLLAIRLRRMLEDRLGCKVTLRSIFDHPTIAGLANTLADVTEPAGPAVALTADPQTADQPFALTPLQQAYWIGAREDMDGGGVGTQCYIEFDTQLSLERIDAALAQLIARHGMLRAVVDPDGRQRVLPDPGVFPLPVEDLRACPDRDEKLAAFRAARSHHRCDTSAWPLLGVWALRLPDRIRLQISLPAILLDAHSAYLLAREFFDLIDGRPLAGPGPAFRDLVIAMQAEGASCDQARTDLPAAPQLPMRRDPKQLGEVRFRRESLRLPAEIWSRIRAAAAAQGLTPTGAVLSAFAWALTAWTEQDPFTLVVTYFDRPPLHPDIASVVGDFTSARLLSVHAAADLRDFSRNLQAGLWEALDDPALDSVKCGRAMRRSGRNETFGVVFTSTLGLEGAPESKLGEVAFALTQTSQVWLDHKVREEGGALVCTWDFVDGLFREGVAEGLLEAFERVLRDIAGGAWEMQAPPLPRAQDEARRAYGETTWSPRLPLLHQTLFNALSDAEALVCGADRLSRKALGAAASQVARRLLAAGLEPGDVVAIPSRHGWRQAAAALGVMAAGGVWAPVDPDWPEQRICEVIKAGKVTHSVDWAGSTLPGAPGRVTIEDSDQHAPVPLPERDRGLEDLAYVIFTSGSTGIPKGVQVTHGGAVNTLADLIDRFAIREPRIFGLSRLHFDLAVFDLFGAWLADGVVIHPQPHEARDPEAWARTISTERVTVWNSVPALALMLVEHLEGRGQRLETLQLALLSGDWIPLDLPDRLRAVAPNCRIVSLGGATEGSIWSIAHPIAAIDPDWTSIPYGKPLRGQGMHVLDARRNRRADWAIGEIHISGLGVARGYCGDPELTAERFWRNPVTGEPMYATGDLGRFRPEGWIEFLGRRDGQVKVAGHRIELSEIEAVLSDHCDIRRAVVSAPLAPSGQRLLVAHVVGEVGESEIRRHVAQRLPASHMPQRIVLRESIPLTANGKVDRALLHAIPAADAPPAPGPAPAPASARLQVLDLMRDLLERPDAGPDDDFFALGGDSVLAVRLLRRVEQDMGRRLAIRDVFANPTASGLSRLMRDEAPAAEASIDPEVREQAKARRGRRAVEGDARPLDAGRSSAGEASRESHRTFSALAIPGERIEGLLGKLCSQPDGRRLHPTAGGAYGVQAYLLVSPGRVEGYSGSWWLDADAGCLRPIGEEGWSPAMADRPPNTSLARGAAFAVALVADLDTLEPLYGGESVRLATLEAGYMAQVVAAAAPTFDLGLCPLGSVDEAALDQALELGPRRKLLHVLLGGRPLESLICEDASWNGRAAPPRRTRSRPQRVLLTGASGRLGSALLETLLDRGSEVVCLLRGGSGARLAELLHRANLDHRASQVKAIDGALPICLDPCLTGDIDVVVHAAADVSFVKQYAELRAANVSGARSVLAFCAQMGADLHYISSLSVFREAGQGLLPETEPLPCRPPQRGGYAQSKWAAERMVRAFADQGGQAHIHRLALLVSPDPGPTDYLAALQQGCRAVGAWPEVDVDLPVIRLDVAARAVAAAIDEPPRTWHLQEPAKVTMRQLADHIGGLESLSPDRWLRRVEAAVAAAGDHPLAPYLEVLRSAREGGVLDPRGPRGGHLDGSESWERLGALGVAPTDDPRVILDMLQ
jgi:natural product biosynthesis luciferase-like monooxygenase protein/amino acid adenylation domain-containing protein